MIFLFPIIRCEGCVCFAHMLAWFVGGNWDALGFAERMILDERFDAPGPVCFLFVKVAIGTHDVAPVVSDAGADLAVITSSSCCSVEYPPESAIGFGDRGFNRLGAG